MSARFIIEWCGAPVSGSSGGVWLVQEWQADRYLSEADAWLAAQRLKLPPGIKVVHLQDRNAARVLGRTSAGQNAATAAKAPSGCSALQ